MHRIGCHPLQVGHLKVSRPSRYPSPGRQFTQIVMLRINFGICRGRSGLSFTSCRRDLLDGGAPETHSAHCRSGPRMLLPARCSLIGLVSVALDSARHMVK